MTLQRFFSTATILLTLGAVIHQRFMIFYILSALIFLFLWSSHLDEEEAIFVTKIASFLLLVSSIVIFAVAPSLLNIAYVIALSALCILGVSFAEHEQKGLARDLVSLEEA